MEPFIGEIRTTAFLRAPRGWALCNGQLLAIASNQALFSLLGTNYGGDGVRNFGLPDLRGCSPMHPSGGFALGQRGGEAQHTLTLAEMPRHRHRLRGSKRAARSPLPAGALPAEAASNSPPIWSTATNLAQFDPEMVGLQGSGQAHENMPPYLVLNFIIALQGIFPSRG